MKQPGKDFTRYYLKLVDFREADRELNSDRSIVAKDHTRMNYLGMPRDLR
jgi:hypothetical protein